MEGPTPVSALLHAATMVTAGVFFLIKCSFCFEQSSFLFFNFCQLVGAFTAFFGAFCAIYQYDIKKIIAYSTCSQLGYMVYSCGCSGYDLAFFHLINHGFFKALLFLSAGILIHNLMDEQDIRKMGGLFFFFPITYSFFIIGSFSLIGFPFLSGYFSKEAIIALALNLQIKDLNFSFVNLNYHLLTLAISLSTIYSLRLLYYVFLTKPRGYKFFFKKNNFEEASDFVLSLLSFLALLSIFSGYLLKDIFFLSNVFNFSITKNNLNNLFFFYEIINPTLNFIPFIYIFLGFFFFTFTKTISIKSILNYDRKYYILDVYFKQGLLINNVCLKLVKYLLEKLSLNFLLVEKGLIEMFFPKLLFSFLKNLTIFLFFFQQYKKTKTFFYFF